MREIAAQVLFDTIGNVRSFISRFFYCRQFAVRHVPLSEIDNGLIGAIHKI